MKIKFFRDPPHAPNPFIEEKDEESTQCKLMGFFDGRNIADYKFIRISIAI